MKKLLLSILLLGGLSASAQTAVIKTDCTDYNYFNVKLERVSYRNEKYGTSIEQSKEIEFRKATLAKYKKLGYAFDGMVTGANGKFMKFVK